jgi:hypothetical protein
LLREIVTRHWRGNLSDGVLESRLINDIFQTIDIAATEKTSSIKAMQYFQTFYSIHQIAFGKTLREKVIATVKEITDTFQRDVNQPRLVGELNTMLMT